MPADAGTDANGRKADQNIGQVDSRTPSEIGTSAIAHLRDNARRLRLCGTGS